MNGIIDPMDEFKQILGDGEGQVAWRPAVHGVAKNQIWLSDWMTTTEAKQKDFLLIEGWLQ